MEAHNSKKVPILRVVRNIEEPTPMEVHKPEVRQRRIGGSLLKQLNALAESLEQDLAKFNKTNN